MSTVIPPKNAISVPPLNNIRDIVIKHTLSSDAAGSSAFIASFFLVGLLSEILGSIVGWPTFTGLLFALFHLQNAHVSIIGMVLLLFVQILFLGVTLFFYSLSAWPIVFLAQGSASKTVRPNTNLKETLLGGFFGLLGVIIVATMIKGVPGGRTELQISEAVFAVLIATGIFIYIRFPSVHKYSVTEHSHVDHVFEEIAQTFELVEVSLNGTVFQKSVILGSDGDDYIVLDRKQPFRLDSRDHLLINFGLIEQQMSHISSFHNKVKTSISSARVFVCDVTFGFTFAYPSVGDRFDKVAVIQLLHNYYDKGTQAGDDVKHDPRYELLKQFANLAISSYVGEVDERLQREIESFNRKALKIEQRSSAIVLQKSSPRFRVNQEDNAISGQIEALQLVVDECLALFNEYDVTIEEARKLQSLAIKDLPGFFDREMLKHFLLVTTNTQSLSDLYDDVSFQSKINEEPHRSVITLLACARPKLSLAAGDFKFTVQAEEANSFKNTTLNTFQNRVAQSIAELTAESIKRGDEYRQGIASIISQISPSMLLTQDGANLLATLHNVQNDQSLLTSVGEAKNPPDQQKITPPPRIHVSDGGSASDLNQFKTSLLERITEYERVMDITPKLLSSPGAMSIVDDFAVTALREGQTVGSVVRELITRLHALSEAANDDQPNLRVDNDEPA